VLKKASRNRDAADIAVDNPATAMQQFTDGLRRVLMAPKMVGKGRPKGDPRRASARRSRRKT
jgi:hypothetical protein